MTTMARWLLVAIFSSLVFLGCESKTSHPPEAIKRSDIVVVSVGVQGMTCVGCEVTLEETLDELSGVVSTKASHDANQVEIHFDTTKTTSTELARAIEEAGYSVSEIGTPQAPSGRVTQ